MSSIQKIYSVNGQYKWLREPLLMRLPDNSLFCEIFVGGDYDGCQENVIAAIRSDDDGQTWSDIEVVKAIKGVGCWAASVFADEKAGRIFWFTLDQDRAKMTNHLLSSGADGRTFTDDKVIMQNWNRPRGVDIRRGVRLRNGKVLLPIAWQEPVDEANSDDIKMSDAERKKLANVGGARAANKIAYCGVAAPNDDFTEFERFGRICHLTSDGALASIPLFENQIAELSDGTLAMLIRGDTTNRLWRSDSHDQGRTWSDPIQTEIKNPGSKPLIINLPDGRIVLFNNPNEKDYDDIESHHHAYRTPLEMWISDDDMKTWSVKETLVAAPQVAMYPDGFYDDANKTIYLVWENDNEVFFKKINVS